MKAKTLDLGTIVKGETKAGELEYANLTKEAHKVALATLPAHTYLINQVTLENPQPDQVGKFVFAIDTKATKLYGPVEEYAYVVIDDAKLDKSETYQLTIKADIVEDFTGMTMEEKQQAPIIEMDKEYYLGKIAAGKVQKFVLPVKNTGVNPLEIRRVYSDKLTIKSTPKAIKSGKKGAVAFDVNTKDMHPGSYTREITVISNDFEHARKKVTVTFDVE